VGARLGTVRAPGARGGSADVWFARVAEHAPGVDRLVETLLSGEERERAGGYRSHDTSVRYVVTRSLVRTVLSERLGVQPREVSVRRTEAGKPVVLSGLHFNVSHSGDLVVLAVSTDRDLGVDLERRREVPRVDALVQRWLTAEEREELGRRVAEGADVSDAFLRVWSFKEARLKALGVGISGASSASFGAVDAIALDDLLDQVAADAYVGALAFA